MGSRRVDRVNDAECQRAAIPVRLEPQIWVTQIPVACGFQRFQSVLFITLHALLHPPPLQTRDRTEAAKHTAPTSPSSIAAGSRSVRRQRLQSSRDPRKELVLDFYLQFNQIHSAVPSRSGATPPSHR